MMESQARVEICRYDEVGTPIRAGMLARLLSAVKSAHHALVER